MPLYAHTLCFPAYSDALFARQLAHALFRIERLHGWHHAQSGPKTLSRVGFTFISAVLCRAGRGACSLAKPQGASQQHRPLSLLH